jgi:predicted methyltransferase
VNAQLDKVDRVTDSAVDAADSVATAVRAISLAITRPVEKISGLAAGLSHGIAALRVKRNPRAAFEAGRTAATRREREIAEELEHGAQGP